MDSNRKKQKSTNWREDVTLQLIQEVGLRKKAITGKFTKGVTNIVRRKACEDITNILIAASQNKDANQTM